MSKNMIVLGGGESGVGAALLGQHLGYNVFLSDKGAIGQLFKGFFGYNGNPTSTELISWFLTLSLVTYFWKRASRTT